MFRGITKTKQEVKGYYLVSNDKHYIIDCYGVTITALALADTISDFPGYHEVIPKSLAMDTTLKDKDKTPIYGSFPLDGEMTKGGDRGTSVSGKTWDVEWEGIGFDPFVANMEHSGDGWHYEVIGTQFEDK